MRVVVSESVVGDLDVLDYLELFQSTIYAAEALGISQSSCSRRYRSFSEQFDFGFDRVDGVYRPTRNFDMLAALRQAAQKRSLATAPSGLKDHDGTRWQAAAADGIALSYRAPHDLARLKVDAIEDGCFHTHLKAMAELFGKSAATDHPGLRLLC